MLDGRSTETLTFELPPAATVPLEGLMWHQDWLTAELQFKLALPTFLTESICGEGVPPPAEARNWKESGERLTMAVGELVMLYAALTACGLLVVLGAETLIEQL